LGDLGNFLKIDIKGAGEIEAVYIFMREFYNVFHKMRRILKKRIMDINLIEVKHQKTLNLA